MTQLTAHTLTLLSFFLISFVSSLVAQNTLQEQFQDPVAGYEYYLEADRIYQYGRNHQDYSERVRALNSCIPRYKKFLRALPNHPDSQRAQYRLGVAKILTGQLQSGERDFKSIIKKYQRGQLVAASAYRLAAQRYNQKKYAESVHYFEVAAENTDKPHLKHDAMHRGARCLILTKQYQKAIPALESIVKDQGNPYRDSSALALGHLYLHQKQYPQALATFEKIIGKQVEPQMRAEAMLHAGIAAHELQNISLSQRYLFQTLENRRLPDEFRAKAMLRILEGMKASEEYEGAIKIYETAGVVGQKKENLQIGLIIADCYLKTEKYQLAIKHLTQTERLSPLSKIGFEASFKRLACFFNIEGENVPQQADAFLEIYKPRFRSHSFIEQARFLKAEALYRKGDFENAAKAYQRVSLKSLEPEDLAELLYRQAWCLSITNKPHQALQSVNRFIATYPEHEQRFPALAKRAELSLKVNDLDAAENDLKEILKAQPSPQLVTFAHQSMAKILKHNRRFAEMIGHYENVLKSSTKPSSDVIANSHYWMGWGYYQLARYEEAIPHLEKAQQKIPEFYESQASELLILCYFSLQQENPLAHAVKVSLENHPDKFIPIRILSWLGLQFYKKQRYQESDYFLTTASTPSSPNETSLTIWRHLAKSRLHTKNYQRALEALETLIKLEKSDFWRADAYRDQANCFAALKQWSQCKTSIQQSFNHSPPGRVLSDLYLLQGDLAYLKNDYPQAAEHYIKSLELFEDDIETTPVALYKAAATLRLAEQTQQAASYEARLRKDYPQWSPKKEQTFENLSPSKASPSSPLPESSPQPQAQEESPPPKAIIVEDEE